MKMESEFDLKFKIWKQTIPYALVEFILEKYFLENLYNKERRYCACGNELLNEEEKRLGICRDCK